MEAAKQALVNKSFNHIEDWINVTFRERHFILANDKSVNNKFQHMFKEYFGTDNDFHINKSYIEALNWMLLPITSYLKKFNLQLSPNIDSQVKHAFRYSDINDSKRLSLIFELVDNSNKKPVTTCLLSISYFINLFSFVHPPKFSFLPLRIPILKPVGHSQGHFD